MKKIPCLFERKFENHHVSEITPIVTPGMEWVLQGKGIATVKFDGSCCAILNGEFYRRYDTKAGKTPPRDAIPCCKPDPITGHWPHWLKCNDRKADKWYWEAYNNTLPDKDGTYEAVGPHFQGNPYGLEKDILVPHGQRVVDVTRTFEGIRGYLGMHPIEGLVFWKDGKPRCKIKRTDFGFGWPASLTSLDSR